MPTSRPRHQVTETPDVRRALEVAEREWPNESRGALLVHLAVMGAEELRTRQEAEAERRRRAMRELAGAYDEAFDENFLAELREDWPA